MAYIPLIITNSQNIVPQIKFIMDKIWRKINFGFDIISNLYIHFTDYMTPICKLNGQLNAFIYLIKQLGCNLLSFSFTSSRESEFMWVTTSIEIIQRWWFYCYLRLSGHNDRGLTEMFWLQI